MMAQCGEFFPTRSLDLTECVSSVIAENPACFSHDPDPFIYGALSNERGMPNFTGELTPQGLEKLRAFIQGTADAIRPKSAAQQQRQGCQSTE